MVKNLSANAGDIGSIPGPERSLLKPVCLRTHALQQEKSIHQNKIVALLTTTREKPVCSNEGPAQPKKNPKKLL